MTMTLLALVPESATARRCLELARAAAEVVGADIEAFHVVVDPDHLRTGDEEVALQHMRIREEGTARARAKAVRSIYEVWRAHLPAEQAGRTTWREAVGAEEAAVAAEARSADLVVLGRPHNLDGGDAHHAAFRRSHRPLLVAPDHAQAVPGGFARRMAIAWKPGAHAQRAVEGAAAWLRRAHSVDAVMVAESLDQAGWPDLQRLSRQLGFEVSPALMPPDGAAADHILSAVQDLRSDCLVLGAYRHADVIEWALPSTTRQMLDRATTPLFMAH